MSPVARIIVAPHADLQQGDGALPERCEVLLVVRRVEMPTPFVGAIETCKCRQVRSEMPRAQVHPAPAQQVPLPFIEQATEQGLDHGGTLDQRLANTPHKWNSRRAPTLASHSSLPGDTSTRSKPMTVRLAAKRESR